MHWRRACNLDCKLKFILNHFYFYVKKSLSFTHTICFGNYFTLALEVINRGTETFSKMSFQE